MAQHNTPVAGFNAKPENINRKGAPKKEWTWEGLLRKVAEECVDEKLKKEIVASRIWSMAMKGDIAAIKEIMNRMEGMPKQAIEQDIHGDIAIVLQTKK